MNCPSCGSKKILKLVSGYYVCECGYQWKEEDLTFLEKIDKSQTPEAFAELFIRQNGFGLWTCIIFPGAWCDKQNAVAAVLQYFKQKIGA